GVVSGLPRKAIQLGMGGALFAAAVLMLMTNLGAFPGGGEALALSGPKLIAGIVGKFALGALMTLGIGLYAPCMILVSLLGMSPLAAFPIMMGSCAFLMPLGSVGFLRSGRYDLRAALGLALGGIPGVLIAAFIVKSMPLEWLRWLVVVVVVYASVLMLNAARKP
ncbi:MAG: TSUP family transporter, partial [Methylocella sp.]